MGGVTVLTASYAGAASAPAYARLAGLAAELAGEQLVRRDAGWPVLLYASADEAIEAAKALREAAALVPAGELLRIALHTAMAVAPAVRHAEQLLAIANPGQTLLTATTTAMAEARGISDLGVHRLRDLGSAERIFELTATGVPLHSLDCVPNNLPVMFTSFVGRTTQVAALRTQLAGSRLVTLTGPGGSGKTRLAAQTAAHLAERWTDGVWWVDLSAVTDSTQIPEMVAAAVGLLVEPGDRLLIGQLRHKQALVCLDNCEQIIDGVAEFVTALQTGCPELSILATSREPLDVPGESVWRVPALSPDEARTLFLERSDASADDVEAERAVRAICLRLDGIPLALELAAAWGRTLTPMQIEAGLEDRFGLLTKNVRGAAARQRTLAASIDWSYDLLDDDERQAFRRLAVFAGGFTLEAAAAVSGAVPNILARLVDKSLVVAEDGRYRLLETIREYAATRLADDDVRDRHLDHYLSVAEAAEALLDSDRDAWRALIEPDRENYRAALEHGLAADDPDRGRRLAAALRWLWNLQATGAEGIGYLRRAVDRAPDDRTLLQARLFYGYATVADTVDPFGYDAAGRGLDLATELGDDRLRSLFLAMVAVGEFFTDFQKAWDLTAEGVRLADGIGNEHARNANVGLQCVLLSLWDRHDDLYPLLDRAATGLITSGERGIASTVLTTWSESLMSTGEPRKAVELAERALAAAEPLADFHRVGSARAQLASVLVRTGRPDEARALMRPLLELADTGSVVPNLGQVMSVISYWTGEYDAAVEWLARDTAPDSPLAGTFAPAMLLPTVAAAKRALGQDTTELLERAADLARAYNLPRILADALDQLGRTAIAERPDKAAELLHEALTIRVDHGLRTYLIDSLESLALLANHTNRPADAARLARAASNARDDIGLAVPADHPELPLSDEAPLTLDEAVAYARRTRGTRGRPSSGWASLTPTEEQVVALAVEGLSNPEIGERLFMSRGTVKTHLAHVYTKLGVANRTELASLKKP
ncbi:putative ATPase/DNA-binding CsgD family transcriptional regulator [Kribbella aluminosa]|uniref:ATPase/DNA-binding CsgD family transcriptional regulator n=1 Tax=Kribbella aluminosa TaxID=416017 RepID=A0ABS4UUF2_9ACTN|nr:LuxR C-terminal-related transcriptional regulator [Kribbella aluminosa]MBP2355270.1 putative ATPase/DNA-binding CsgD family transcriptional regulator [Kribbella aluminosa]